MRITFEEIASTRGSHPYAFRVPYLRSMVPGDAYKFEVSLYTDAVRWCIDQFGEMNSLPAYRWTHSVDRFTFTFRDAADATAFKIRWC